MLPCFQAVWPIAHTSLYKQSHNVFSVLHSECNTNFPSQVVSKHCILSVSSEALVPSTAILILSANCILLLPELVTGPIVVHIMQWLLNACISVTHYTKCFITGSQT